MRALITGVCGQDGFYLSRLLLSKGYTVHGILQRHAQEQEAPDGVHFHVGDICDADFVNEVTKSVTPDEFYNLAALTHVGNSFTYPRSYIETNTIGTLNCLRAVNRWGYRFYQASTSELFGDSPPPQNEVTEMRPRSPYGCSKLAAYWLTRNYRDMGMFAVNGILFNHESPRRGLDFVTRKVCRAAVRISKGEQETLRLGNLKAKRDWGHAKDFVNGMWLMLQQQEPEDFVLATGEAHTVAELCEEAFSLEGLNWMDHVKIDHDLLRPLDVEHLLGDPRKAEIQLKWTRQYTFKSLVREMVDAER